MSIWDYLRKDPIYMHEAKNEAVQEISERQPRDSATIGEVPIKRTLRTTRANHSSALLFPNEMLPKMRRLDRLPKISSKLRHMLRANTP
jgi:hypothetical protein